MTDLLTETLVLLADAPSEIPGPPSLSSIRRWSRHGVRGAKLETILVGGRRFTSLEAIERFLALTAQRATPHSAPAIQVELAAEAADAILEAEGL